MIEMLRDTPVASLIFVITIITTVMAFNNQELLSELILHPYSVARKKRIYTVITSGLIHGDWMHLAFNMFSYFWFAFPLERLMGHWQFGLLYVASLILSDLPTIYKHKDDYNYRSLGASGAVSAVIFGFIMYHPASGMYIMPIPYEIPAIIYGPLYLVYCYFSSKQARDNVNHDAHMYGALSGLIIVILFDTHVVSQFISEVSRAYFHG
jgi:membrane associated rhomboid family serine protease